MKTKKPLKIIGGLVIILLILGIIAEVGARWYVAKDISQRVDTKIGAQEGQKTTVSFGKSPLIFGLISSTVPHAVINTPSTADNQAVAEGAMGVPAATITVSDFSFKNRENPVAGHLDITSTIPDAYLKVKLQDALNLFVEENRNTNDPALSTILSMVGSALTITNVSSNPETNTINLTLNEGLGEITVAPEKSNNDTVFIITKATLMNLPLPEVITTNLADAINNNIMSIKGPLVIESATAATDGLAIHVTGNNVALDDVTVN